MSFKTVNAMFLAFLSAENIQPLLGEISEDSMEKLAAAWKEQENKLKKLLEKTKAKKPADAPKKNKSGYLFFCQEMRSVVKEENPDMKTNEIMAELGARWKELKENEPEEVKKYMEMAGEDKTRYEQEMKNYVPSADEEEKPKEKKPRAKKSKDEKPKETPAASPVKSTKSTKSAKKVEKTEEELYIESVQAVIKEVIDATSDGAITAGQVKAALKEKGIKAPKNLKEMIIAM
jgi:hypothetical protein